MKQVIVMLNLATIVCGILVGHSAIMPLPATDGADVTIFAASSAVATLLQPVPTQAGSDRESDVQATLQSILTKPVPELPPSRHIRWTREFHAGMSEREIAALRDKIAGKVDHPERAELDVAARRLKSGPERMTCDVYTGEKGEFRYCMTWDHGEWTDVGISHGVVWMFLPETLVLLKESSPPPPNRRYILHKAEATKQIYQFGLGALCQLINLPNLLVRSCTAGPAGWTCRVSFGENVGEFEVRGRNTEFGQRAYSSKLALLPIQPAEVGASMVSRATTIVDGLGPLDTVVEEFSPTGALKFRNTFILSEPFTDISVFDVPSPTTPQDKVRGSVKITKFTSYLDSAAGETTEIDTNGTSHTGPADSAPQQSSGGSLNSAGYFLIVTIAALGAGLWLFRRSKSS